MFALMIMNRAPDNYDQYKQYECSLERQFQHFKQMYQDGDLDKETFKYICNEFGKDYE